LLTETEVDGYKDIVLPYRHLAATFTENKKEVIATWTITGQGQREKIVQDTLEATLPGIPSYEVFVAHSRPWESSYCHRKAEQYSSLVPEMYAGIYDGDSLVTSTTRRAEEPFIVQHINDLGYIKRTIKDGRLKRKTSRNRMYKFEDEKQWGNHFASDAAAALEFMKRMADLTITRLYQRDCATGF
jgi:hypothetical protein